MRVITVMMLFFGLVIGVLVSTSDSFAQHQTVPAYDVRVRLAQKYAYQIQGGYTQWNLSDIYTQSVSGDFNVVYAVHSNFNVYGGLGVADYFMQTTDPDVTNLKQKYHLTYQVGMKAALWILYADASYRYNPVSGTVIHQQYEYDNEYMFHEFPSKVGLYLNMGNITVTGGVLHHFTTGKRESVAYRVRSDTNRIEIGSSSSQFSETAPLSVYGGVQVRFSEVFQVGIEAVYREQDNFILRLNYFKVQF